MLLMRSQFVLTSLIVFLASCASGVMEPELAAEGTSAAQIEEPPVISAPAPPPKIRKPVPVAKPKTAEQSEQKTPEVVVEKESEVEPEVMQVVVEEANMERSAQVVEDAQLPEEIVLEEAHSEPLVLAKKERELAKLAATSNADEAAPGLRASRSFAAPGQFPPQRFAAYGILAFPENPNVSDETLARFNQFCNAFMSGIVSSGVLEKVGVQIEAQMVTVLPLASTDAAEKAKKLGFKPACDFAGDNYGLSLAQDAILRANRAEKRTDGTGKLNGRGPHLIAWSPGASFGTPDSLVLVSNLSNSVSDEQIRNDIRLWVDVIQKNPDLWKDGWNLDAFKLAGQRWIDRRATSVLELIGKK